MLQPLRELLPSERVHGGLWVLGAHSSSDRRSSNSTEFRADDHTNRPTDRADYATDDSSRLRATETAHYTSSNLVRRRVVCHAELLLHQHTFELCDFQTIPLRQEAR